MSKKIDHIAFVVKDIEESCKFYSKKLELNVVAEYNDWALLRNENIVLALTLEGKHPYHIAVKCATIDEVKEYGEPVKHRDGTYSVYEKDGSGNAIEWIYYPQKG
jgi:catechol 2,3-dioxygenase-like lactoylglutathione lyase family enzyme